MDAIPIVMQATSATFTKDLASEAEKQAAFKCLEAWAPLLRAEYVIMLRHCVYAHCNSFKPNHVLCSITHSVAFHGVDLHWGIRCFARDSHVLGAKGWCRYEVGDRASP